MLFKYIFLGIIQGFTEFLPVSSSGHLTILQHMMGMNQNILFITTLLHLGTILSVLTFFSKDILATLKDSRVLINIFLVNVITGILAIIFKKFFESLFLSSQTAAVFLIVNGVMLIITKNIKRGSKEVSRTSCVIMGLTQTLAIAPGISRSGITITTLLLRGIKKESAFNFSFIASIPLIIAAFCSELKEIDNINTFGLHNLIIGIAVAYLSGLCALGVLKKIIKLEKFYLFGYYCLAIGLCAVFFLRK